MVLLVGETVPPVPGLQQGGIDSGKPMSVNGRGLYKVVKNYRVYVLLHIGTKKPAKNISRLDVIQLVRV